MELVGVPAGIFEDTDFREPLAEEVVAIDVTGACKWPWNLRVPFNIDVHRPIRWDRLRQRHRRNRPVRRIAVVWRDESKARCKVVASVQRDAKRFDVRPTPCIRPRRRAVSAKAALTQPGGLSVAPRVPVEVELQLAGRIGADVPPPDV